jgi:hypothetical protein
MLAVVFFVSLENQLFFGFFGSSAFAALGPRPNLDMKPRFFSFSGTEAKDDWSARDLTLVFASSKFSALRYECADCGTVCPTGRLSETLDIWAAKLVFEAAAGDLGAVGFLVAGVGEDGGGGLAATGGATSSGSSGSGEVAVAGFFFFLGFFFFFLAAPASGASPFTGASSSSSSSSSSFRTPLPLVWFAPFVSEADLLSTNC